MEKKIAILAGDGIGPEVMQQALRVLEAINKRFTHNIKTEKALVGGAAFEEFNVHLPEETIEICKNSDAILFGSVGGPVEQATAAKWKDCERNSILALRKTFNFYANIRPTLIIPCLAALSPLKADLLKDGVDLVILRELCGDIYFGEHKTFNQNGLRTASDQALYNEEQIALIARKGFELASLRTKKLTSVDKANVLDTSRLWRDVVTEVSKDYPEVKLEHMLVDNCAMQLILNPKQFDVILTANLFGDILSDAASAIPGSLGLSPSASLNQAGLGMFEPSGGSAPAIANQNIANPCAQILSLAMLLRLSFNLTAEAAAIENAVTRTIEAGNKTADLCLANETSLGTKEFTDKVLELI